MAATYPQEGIAFLGGNLQKGGTRNIQVFTQAENQSTESTRRFEVDPVWLSHLEKDWDSRNLTMLGTVHSHPGCAPIPSETDRLFATYWPGFIWWIVRTEQEGPGDSRFWQLGADERFSELSWVRR